MFTTYTQDIASYLTPDAFVNALQTTKRGLTDKIITDPTLNKAAHDYITAQTDFAKMLTLNFTELSKYTFDAYTKNLFPVSEKVTKTKAPKARAYSDEE